MIRSNSFRMRILERHACPPGDDNPCSNQSESDPIANRWSRMLSATPEPFSPRKEGQFCPFTAPDVPQEDASRGR